MAAAGRHSAKSTRGGVNSSENHAEYDRSVQNGARKNLARQRLPVSAGAVVS